ncbi:MAG: type IV secretion protein IcmS [Gammaproteobacteria bacterium GWE2_42_36]|nr:MAG: type IV secretion protein IcmS [Gammaproteobacteria bacterium GWE2_42_36]HCU04769.1 type IV secretion protein IcmS [Coxiellaceae bacterium]
MPTNLIKKLTKLSIAMNFKFSLHSNPISYSEVFSEQGLLPAIARRADQLCSLCLGYGIGATFTETEGTPLGLKVTFDDTTPNTLRYLCLLDVLSELAKAAKGNEFIPLDELMYD